MNYKELVLRSLKLTWGHKWLWVFGLFVGGGFSGGGSNYQAGGGSFNPFPTEGRGDMEWHMFRETATNWISQNVILILLLVVVLFLLLIFVAFLGVVAQGALVGAANNLDKDEETTFSKSLGVGLANFWRLFGFFLLLFLLIMVPVFLIVAFSIFIALMGGAALFFLLLLIPMGLLLIPIFIAIALSANFGIRAIVIEEQRPVAALKSG